MRNFNKTVDYLWESYGGLFVGIIVFCILFVLNPHLSYWKEFIQEIPSMSMCAFGFLLTLLSLILQGNSLSINWMKNNTRLFKRFIMYNKQIVILSFIISIYAYILGYLDFYWIVNKLQLSRCSQVVSIMQKLLIGGICGLISWFVVNTFRFIKIFYLLIQKEK